jgi:hypothetical protein
MKHIHTFESFLNEKTGDQAAYDKIDKLPTGKIFDDAKNIAGVFDISKHGWSETVEAFERGEKGAKPTTVNIKDIEITQPNVQSNKVKKMIADLAKTPVINAVEFGDGKLVIFDGHHRLMANWATGAKKIKVNLVKA